MGYCKCQQAYNMRKIIIAPHADDEIIGCFEILKSGGDILVVSPAPLIEFEKSKEKFNFKLSHISALEGMDLTEAIIFCPDPHYEFHPLHKELGTYGLSLHRKGNRVIFYVTNMVSPYIYECKNTEMKRKALDACYFEKSDLWKYDFKYFLFSGYTEYLNYE